MKQAVLNFAEATDAMRVVPRLFLAWYAALAWDLHQWMKSLPDPSEQQSLYAGAIIGLCVPLLGWYMATGRMWGKGSG